MHAARFGASSLAAVLVACGSKTAPPAATPPVLPPPPVVDAARLIGADSGKPLWSTRTYTGIVAPPITYEANGEQYVAVEVGWGGAFGLAAGQLAHDAQPNQGNVPRVLAFKLHGTDTMPMPPPRSSDTSAPPPNKAGAKVVAEGKLHYHTYCGMCHGDSAFSGGVLPDLRHSVAWSDPSLWQSIVHDGARSANGMVAFGGRMSPREIETIRAYVIYRANRTRGQ